MNKKQERLMAKIRNMLEMARRSNGNEEEAAVAAAMVEKLMRKHNLTIADITPEQAKSEAGKKAYTDMKWTTGRCPQWVNRIAIAIANTYDTVCIFTRAGSNDAHVKKPQQNISYVGLEVDVMVSLEMFAYLYDTIVRCSDEYFKIFPAPEGQARSYKNSYRSGMAARLAGRLVELKREAEQEQAKTGTQLMVVKKDAIAEYLGYEPEYTQRNRNSTKVDSAYAAGHAEGDKVSLNKQLNT